MHRSVLKWGCNFKHFRFVIKIYYLRGHFLIRHSGHRVVHNVVSRYPKRIKHYFFPASVYSTCYITPSFRWAVAVAIAAGSTTQTKNNDKRTGFFVPSFYRSHTLAARIQSAIGAAWVAQGAHCNPTICYRINTITLGLSSTWRFRHGAVKSKRRGRREKKTHS